MTLKVFVTHSSDFARWLNIVTNTGTDPTEVGITLRGALGSGSDTRINATSTGSSSIGQGVTWFTTSQNVPQGSFNNQPRLGFVVQGISFDGVPITVDVGGVVQTFVLNKKGDANNGGGKKADIDAQFENGVTKNAQEASFSFQMKGDFQTQLAAFGLTDATVSDLPVTVPVTFTAVAIYAVDQPITYNAKAGKSGTAKNS